MKKKKSDNLGPMLPKDRPRRLYDLSGSATPGFGVAAAFGMIAINAFLMVRNVLFGDTQALGADEEASQPENGPDEDDLSARDKGGRLSEADTDGGDGTEDRLHGRPPEKEADDTAPASNLVNLVPTRPLLDAEQDTLQLTPETVAALDLLVTAGTNGLPDPVIAAQPSNAPRGAGALTGRPGGGTVPHSSGGDALVPRQKDRTILNNENISLSLLFSPVCLGTLLSDRANAVTTETLFSQFHDTSGKALTKADMSDFSIVDMKVSTGSLLQTADAQWTYNPPENFYGEITLHYTVEDADDSVEQVAYGLVVPDNHPAVIGSGRLYDGTANDFRIATTNTIYGTDRNDVIKGTDSADLIHAGKGNDAIYGYDGNDVIYGEAGHDVIYGGKGNDHIYGGKGNDIAFGEKGDDLIDGGDGNDFADGGDGNDILIGCHGDDVLQGAAGQDILYGGVGKDTLTGGADNDLIVAGADDDVIIASINDGDDEIDGGAGVDVLDLSGTDAAATVDLAAGIIESDDVGHDQIVNIEHVIATQSDDSLTGSDADEQFDGLSGDDVINAGGGRDNIQAGKGDDLITASINDGDDEIDGGAGSDTYDLSHTSASAIVDLQDGYAGSDEIGSDKLKNIEHVTGSAADDTIIFNDAANVVFGGDGNDVFVFGSLDAIQNHHADDNYADDDHADDDHADDDHADDDHADDDHADDDHADDSLSDTPLSDPPFSGRDIIGDFSVGDRIDVSFFKDDDSSGSRGFELVLEDKQDSSEPHLKYHFEQNDENEYRTIIDGYLDDDAMPDFGIEIFGQYNFSGADFIGLYQEGI